MPLVGSLKLVSGLACCGMLYLDTTYFSSIIRIREGDIMAHKFEYRLMQKWITERPISKIPDYSIEQARDALGAHLDIVADDLPDAINKRSSGGDWEVNSHSFAFIGNSILISILLQRPIA